MAVGRPSKYDPKMCKKVVDLMKDGRSKTAIAVELDVNLDTLYEWCNVYPAFSEAIRKGTMLSEVWWEDHGRQNLHNKEFNDRLWFINMKNRFKWSDRVENNTNLNINMHEDLLKELK